MLPSVDIPAGLVLWRVPLFSNLINKLPGANSILGHHVSQIILEWRISFTPHARVLLSLFEDPLSGQIGESATGTLLTLDQLHTRFSFILDSRYPVPEPRVRKKFLNTKYWFFSPIMKVRCNCPLSLTSP